MEKNKRRKDDQVDHPSHYNQGRYEVIDILDDWFPAEPYAWQVVKYMARFRHKGNPILDLKKAQWYLNRLIARVEDQVAREDSQ